MTKIYRTVTRASRTITLYIAAVAWPGMFSSPLQQVALSNIWNPFAWSVIRSYSRCCCVAYNVITRTRIISPVLRALLIASYVLLSSSTSLYHTLDRIMSDFFFSVLFFLFSHRTTHGSSGGGGGEDFIVIIYYDRHYHTDGRYIIMHALCTRLCVYTI